MCTAIDQPPSDLPDMNPPISDTYPEDSLEWIHCISLCTMAKSSSATNSDQDHLGDDIFWKELLDINTAFIQVRTSSLLHNMDDICAMFDTTNSTENSQISSSHSDPCHPSSIARMCSQQNSMSLSPQLSPQCPMRTVPSWILLNSILTSSQSPRVTEQQ